MGESRALRFVDGVGEKTLTSVEWTYKRAKELPAVIIEQEDAVRSLLAKRKLKTEERKKAIERRVPVTDAEPKQKKEDLDKLLLYVEELSVPFHMRMVTRVSDNFTNYPRLFNRFFKDIQEDLYKAKVTMPAVKYTAFSVGISTIVSLVFVSLTLLLGLGVYRSIPFVLVGLTLSAMAFFVVLTLARMYPQLVVKGRPVEFARELPAALRHMATQLSSGSGLLDTMRSVAQSDYGVLSEEFRRVIIEIERGATVEEALERLNLRIDSPGLRRATRQIVSTMKTGGNLANTLRLIAEETSNEMRMKLKDFIQTLNTFSLMYMFVVVIAPVLITTLTIGMGIAAKALPVSSETLGLVYLAFFSISIYMSFMIKRFEPRL